MRWDNLEAQYYEFLIEQGYIDPGTNAEVLSAYLPYFEPGGRVVDLGCGQGQFLRLLAEHGCQPVGVDIDLDMVAAARQGGYDVRHADLHTFLQEAEPHQFDGLFSSNVIEHLSPEEVLGMLQAAQAALKPGGTIVLATPNPESLIVHLSEFWRDPTHTRPYHRQLVEFLLVYSGFRLVAAGTNPHTAWQLPGIEPAGPVPLGGLPAMPEEEPPLPSPPPVEPRTDGVEAARDGSPAGAEEAFAAGWDVEEVLGAYAFLPATNTRRRIAEFIYSMTGEVDLRLYRLEMVLGQYSRRVAQEHARLGQTDEALARAHEDLERAHEDLERAHTGLERAHTGLVRAHDQLASRHRALEGHVATLVAYAERLAGLGQQTRAQTQALQQALHLLFPPREIYVVGQKPEQEHS